MIQFIHVYLNITILYQGDAMQISNLVSQYNNSVANGEPMTGAKGVEKLVSSLNEMSKGMIFEGTVSSVRGNRLSLPCQMVSRFWQGWQESFHLNRDSLCFFR